MDGDLPRERNCGAFAARVGAIERRHAQPANIERRRMRLATDAGQDPFRGPAKKVARLLTLFCLVDLMCADEQPAHPLTESCARVELFASEAAEMFAWRGAKATFSAAQAAGR